MGIGATLVMWSYSHLYKFSFPFTHKLSKEIWFQMTQQIPRETSFNFEIWVTFGQSQMMTLTFDTHLTSLTHLFEYLNKRDHGPELLTWVYRPKSNI